MGPADLRHRRAARADDDPGRMSTTLRNRIDEHIETAPGISARVRAVDADMAIVTFTVHGGHVLPAERQRLVAAVLDRPTVRDRSRLLAALPSGDCEILRLLQNRFDRVDARAAGATCLVDARRAPG